MTMNLLYDHQIFSMQRYGGVSRYFYELISRLCREAEVDISLFLGFYINKYGIESYRSHFGHFWGMKYHPIPKIGILLSLVNEVLFNLFIDKQRSYVYHQTYYTYFGRKLNCKRVVTVYDMIHELYPQYFSHRDTTSRNKEKMVLNSDAIICISQSTRNDLMNYYNVPDDRISVIYLGNSLNLEVIAPRLVDGPYILYVGHRNGYKNFKLLLTAYARAHKIRSDFKLICFAGGKFNIQEQALIRSLDLSNKVLEYAGTDEVLANLYKYATAFVYPSLYEGFGIPPLEAMHYGCPVLVSNTSSILEVVGQAGLYFNPTSVDDLSFHLDKILHDDMLRTELTQRGHEQEKIFSWDVCAKETLKLYHQI